MAVSGSCGRVAGTVVEAAQGGEDGRVEGGEVGPVAATVLDNAAACELVAEDALEVVQLAAGRDGGGEVGEREAVGVIVPPVGRPSCSRRKHPSDPAGGPARAEGVAAA